MQHKIFSLLEQTEHGFLSVETPDGKIMEFGNAFAPLKAHMSIHDYALFELVLAKGDIGFGEAYIQGLYSTDNIENLMSFFLFNQQHFEQIFHSNFLFSLWFTVKNLFKRNSLQGSKSNIEYHYDLGNNFYELWLDSSMSYSSGIYQSNHSLIEAQSNKYNKILQHFTTSASKILEIGCGWGGFIENAAHLGYGVRGLTLSKPQYQYTKRLIEDKKLNAEVVLQDYRHESGLFDHIVSIEMFEAVGKQYWSNYFHKIRQCLKPDGKAIIQSIVINDKYFAKYQKTSDFIREYIFPGGFLPSPSLIKQTIKEAHLTINSEFYFGDSYRRTLLAWLNNFCDAEDKIARLGFSKTFIRKWKFYLAYCAASFQANRTDVVQYEIIHNHV